jgi:hypothetical protein
MLSLWIFTISQYIIYNIALILFVFWQFYVVFFAIIVQFSETFFHQCFTPSNIISSGRKLVVVDRCVDIQAGSTNKKWDISSPSYLFDFFGRIQFEF